MTFVEQSQAHVEAMRANGLRVEMPNETVTTDVHAIHLCEVAELRHPFDIVLVLMKAYDTRWACELIKPYVTAGGLVVGVQNGMTIHTIADVMGPDRALGAVLEVSSAMYRPGVVERHTPPSGSWFTVGGIDPSTLGREWEVVDLLKRASGTVEVADDIVSSKWMKLVVNCAELVTTAIVNMPMKEAVGIPEMREFMLAVGREAMRTAVGLGHRVVPIFGLTDIDPDDPDRALEQMVGAVFGHFSLPTTRTTVLHDWMKGRHSEVDELNRAIVQGAAELGTQAPANARVVDRAPGRARGPPVRPGQPGHADHQRRPVAAGRPALASGALPRFRRAAVKGRRVTRLRSGTPGPRVRLVARTENSCLRRRAVEHGRARRRGAGRVRRAAPATSPGTSPSRQPRPMRLPRPHPAGRPPVGARAQHRDVLLTGVSRSVTHELIRHRHFSYSQLSQRYLPPDGPQVVVPRCGDRRRSGPARDIPTGG